MDLFFFGSGAFGLPTLESLARHHTIRMIVSQPDRPAGRGSRLTPTPIADWASRHLPRAAILKPERVNDPDIVSQIRSIPVDAMIVIAFGQKLGPQLLDRRFAINLHGSLLPRWRGAAPVNAAILAGDTETGNSVITLADRMDAGLILAQSRRDLPPHLTAGELHDLLASDGPELIETVLRAHASGSLAPRPQDESLATRAPKLSRSDGWVDFTDTAENCRRRIHGLTPWPGVTVHLRGTPLKITRVQVADPLPEQPPGTIVDIASGLTACGSSTSLRILEVHPAGRRNMPWSDFVRGHPIAAGDRFDWRSGNAHE